MQKRFFDAMVSRFAATRLFLWLNGPAAAIAVRKEMAGL
jgi:hypothetical protein